MHIPMYGNKFLRFSFFSVQDFMEGVVYINLTAN